MFSFSLGNDQSSLEKPLLGRPPGNSDSLLTSNGDVTLTEGHITEENTASQVKDEQATPGNSLKGIIGEKGEQEKSLRELGEKHLPSPRETSFETVQITHFPVGTNSGIKTTTVKSPVLKNSQRSKSSCAFSPFSSRSSSFIERTQKTSLQKGKVRSRSFANDFMLKDSENTREERHDSFEQQHLIRPVTAPRTHTADGLFDAPRYTPEEVLLSEFSPNLSRAKSFESMLSNTRFKSDNTAYGVPDLPPFQRHSSPLKGGQLNATCNWFYSEPDLTRTLQETVFLTSPCRSPHRNSGQRSEPYKGKKFILQKKNSVVSVVSGPP